MLFLLLLSLPRTAEPLRSRGGPLSVTSAAALALSFRQTNAVWILFSIISRSLTQLAATPDCGAFRERDRRLGPSVKRAAPHIILWAANSKSLHHIAPASSRLSSNA